MLLHKNIFIVAALCCLSVHVEPKKHKVNPERTETPAETQESPQHNCSPAAMPHMMMPQHCYHPYAAAHHQCCSQCHNHGAVTIVNSAHSDAGAAMANKNNLTAHQQNDQKLDQINKHDVTLSVPITLPSLASYLPNREGVVGQINQTSNSMLSWLCKNRWNLSAATIIAAYIATVYQVHQINAMIQASNSWCGWKEILPLGHLVLASPKDLIDQLLLDIHKRYFHIFTTQDPKAVYAQFLNDTRTEMMQLNNYLSWHNFYHTLHATFLVPFKYQASVIDERKARLEFVIDLFMKWHLQQPQVQ